MGEPGCPVLIPVSIRHLARNSTQVDISKIKLPDMQFNALASIFVCHGKPKISLPTFWQGLPAKICYVLEYNGADQTEKIQLVHFFGDIALGQDHK